MKINEAKKNIGVNCSGGKRQAHEIKCAVDHQTVSPFNDAPQMAAYLKGRSDGSVHAVVDDDQTIIIADDLTICCGVSDVNTETLHVEMCGPVQHQSQWLKHTATIDRAAWLIAHWLTKYDLPCEFRTTSDFDRVGHVVQGFTAHKELSMSKLSSSTHTDELTGHAQRYFIGQVNKFYAGMKHSDEPRVIAYI